MNRYTTSEFLTSVRLKGAIPPANAQYTDVGLLAIADDELDTSVLAQIVGVRENFYLTYDTVPRNAANLYDIPSRAIGGAIWGVESVNGDQSTPVNRSDLMRAGSLTLIGNQVRINPPLEGNALAIWHLRRPNKMVPVAAAARIVDLDRVAGTLTFDSLPTTFILGERFDCIQDQPHFNWRFIDYVPTDIVGNVITFASLPDSVEIGDWLAHAGQTPVPQIPVEFIPLLAQRTAIKYYEIQNYSQKAALAQVKLREMELAVGLLVNPRVATSPKRILPNPAHQGGRRWKGWVS